MKRPTNGKKARFFAGHKGGVGKTTCCSATLDVARSRGIVTAAYDADGDVGELLARYGVREASGDRMLQQDPLVGVGYFNVHDELQRELLVNLVDVEAELVIVDLPGGSLGAVNRILPGGFRGLMEVYREEGWDVKVVQVITPRRICAESALSLVEEYGFGSDLVVARNLGKGRKESFFLFDGDGGVRSEGVARRVVEEAGAKVVDFPALRDESYIYVDYKSLPFSVCMRRALERQDPGYRGDGVWLRDWLLAVGAMLDEAKVL